MAGGALNHIFGLSVSKAEVFGPAIKQTFHILLKFTALYWNWSKIDGFGQI